MAGIVETARKPKYYPKGQIVEDVYRELEEVVPKTYVKDCIDEFLRILGEKVMEGYYVKTPIGTFKLKSRVSFKGVGSGEKQVITRIVLKASKRYVKKSDLNCK